MTGTAAEPKKRGEWGGVIKQYQPLQFSAELRVFGENGRKEIWTTKTTLPLSLLSGRAPCYSVFAVFKTDKYFSALAHLLLLQRNRQTHDARGFHRCSWGQDMTCRATQGGRRARTGLLLDPKETASITRGVGEVVEK